MKYLQLSIALLFVCSSILFSQQYLNRDSLVNLLNSSDADTNRVLLYISLGQQFENNDPDSAIHYYLLARDLSEKLGYVTGTMKYLSNITYVYNAQGLYDTALVLNLRALELADTYGSDLQVAACLGNVANSFLYLEKYELAVSYFLQASELISNTGNEQYLCILYNNLAIIYLKLKQSSKAEEFAAKAVHLARKNNDLINLCISLDNLAMASNEAFKPEEAVTYLEEALSLAEETGSDYLRESVLLHMVDSYYQIGKLDKIGPVAEEALQLAKELADQAGISAASAGMAYYHLFRNRVEEAWKYAKYAEEVAISARIPEQIRKVYSLMADISLAEKDFSKFLDYSFLHDSLENIFRNDMLIRNVQELEAKYESEKKAQQISQLEEDKELQRLKLRQDQLILLSLFGFTFTIILVGFFLIRSYRQKQLLYKQEKELQQVRIKEMQAEQNLLVTKAVLRGQEEERSRLSRDLHDSLGGMLSGIKLSFNNLKEMFGGKEEDRQLFKRSMDMLDGSIKELRSIAHNLMPETLLKFGLDTSVNDLCDRINTNSSVSVNYQSVGMDKYHAENEVIITIYRIIQELINNILKHASATSIYLQMIAREGKLEITVEDDGKGFDVNTLKFSSGIGWKNIFNRVHYLKGKVDIRSENGKGTTVFIYI